MAPKPPAPIRMPLQVEEAWGATPLLSCCWIYGHNADKSVGRCHSSLVQSGRRELPCLLMPNDPAQRTAPPSVTFA
jgi:hypothetical protein